MAIACSLSYPRSENARITRSLHLKKIFIRTVRQGASQYRSRSSKTHHPPRTLPLPRISFDRIFWDSPLAPTQLHPSYLNSDLPSSRHKLFTPHHHITPLFYFESPLHLLSSFESQHTELPLSCLQVLIMGCLRMTACASRLLGLART